METLPELPSLVPSDFGDSYNVFVDVLSALSSRSYINPLHVLHVTNMTSRRKDGHSSIYYTSPPASIRKQDCSHWCLPGVPDSWNELLYALFLKHESSNSSSLLRTTV